MVGCPVSSTLLHAVCPTQRSPQLTPEFPTPPDSQDGCLFCMRGAAEPPCRGRRSREGPGRALGANLLAICVPHMAASLWTGWGAVPSRGQDRDSLAVSPRGRQSAGGGSMGGSGCQHFAAGGGRGGGVLGTGGGTAREAGRTREPGAQKGGLARAALAGQEGWRAEELKQGAGQAIPRLADGSPRPRSALSTYPSPGSAKQGPRGCQVPGSRTAGPPSALPCRPGPLTLSIQPH